MLFSGVYEYEYEYGVVGASIRGVRGDVKRGAHAWDI
jgi:hypothetical protein